MTAVVAQLEVRSLPPPEIPCLNPVISIFVYCQLYLLESRNKEKRSREWHYLKLYHIKYFCLFFRQDAVVKGTYDLLPGCATIVLETVLSLQSFAMSTLSFDNGSSMSSSRYLLNNNKPFF